MHLPKLKREVVTSADRRNALLNAIGLRTILTLALTAPLFLLLVTGKVDTDAIRGTDRQDSPSIGGITAPLDRVPSVYAAGTREAAKPAMLPPRPPAYETPPRLYRTDPMMDASTCRSITRLFHQLSDAGKYVPPILFQQAVACREHYRATGID